VDEPAPHTPHGRTNSTHSSWTNQLHTLLVDEPTPHTPRGRTNSTLSSWTNQLHTLLIDEPTPHTPHAHGRTNSTHSSWTNRRHTLLMDGPTPHTPHAHGRTNSTHSSWTNQLHTLLMDGPTPHTPHGRTNSTHSSWTNQLHTLLMDEPTPHFVQEFGKYSPQILQMLEQLMQSARDRNLQGKVSGTAVCRDIPVCFDENIVLIKVGGVRISMSTTSMNVIKCVPKISKKAAYRVPIVLRRFCVGEIRFVQKPGNVRAPRIRPRILGFCDLFFFAQCYHLMHSCRCINDQQMGCETKKLTMKSCSFPSVTHPAQVLFRFRVSAKPDFIHVEPASNHRNPIGIFFRKFWNSLITSCCCPRSSWTNLSECVYVSHRCLSASVRGWGSAKCPRRCCVAPPSSRRSSTPWPCRSCSKHAQRPSVR